MKLLSMSLIGLAAASIAVPALAQDNEPDGTPDLDAIDALLGDSGVTGAPDADDQAANPDTSGEDAEAVAPDDEAGGGAEDAEEAEGAEVSDLTRALASYEDCAIAAGAGLIEQGFAAEQAGEEALGRCGGERAAYVNAFYFELLPRYPGADETDVRASAERLTRQTDQAVAALVAREAPNYEPPAVDESAAESGEGDGE